MVKAMGPAELSSDLRRGVPGAKDGSTYTFCRLDVQQRENESSCHNLQVLKKKKKISNSCPVQTQHPEQRKANSIIVPGGTSLNRSATVIPFKPLLTVYRGSAGCVKALSRWQPHWKGNKHKVALFRNTT